MPTFQCCTKMAPSGLFCICSVYPVGIAPPPNLHFIGGKVVLFLRQVCPFLTIEYLSEMVENNHTGPFLAWAPRIYKYIWIRGPQGGPRGPRVSFDLYHPLLLHF